MKALFYLILIIGVGIAVAWFGFGIHPQALWNKMFNANGSLADMTATATKFRNVAGERFSEAQDVYEGKTEVDDPFAYPNAH